MSKKYIKILTIFALVVLQIIWQTVQNPSAAMDHDKNQQWDKYVSKRHLQGQYGHTNDKVSEIQASYPGWLSTMSGYMGPHCKECENYWEKNPNVRFNNSKKHHVQKKEVNKNDHNKNHDKKEKK